MHSEVIYSSGTTSLDSLFFRGILYPFVQKETSFRLDFLSSESTDYKNGIVKEKLSYNVYIPFEEFLNKRTEQYDSSYVFSTIRELISLQHQFLKK